ncbi:MAG: CHAD domain-containing protein [Rhodospirillales bacterium]
MAAQKTSRKLVLVPKRAQRTRTAPDKAMPPPTPVRADLPRLDRDMTVAMAAHRVLKSCLAHLLDNRLPVLKSDDPEAIHQARVALRRLRAAIAIFKNALRNEEIAFLGHEARWLADELGPARDIDVFLAEVFEPVADAACQDAEGLAAYRGAALELQRQRLARARAALRSRRFTAWRARFRNWLAADVAPPLAVVAGDDAGAVSARYRPVAAYAAEVLTKRDHKVRKRGHHVMNLDAEQRHELRITVKKLRYAAEFFGAIYPHSAKRYIKRLARLQDVLGRFNDVAVAQPLMRDIERATANDGARASTEVHHVSGLIGGWHAARAAAAEQKLRDRWRSFLAEGPFWP